MGLAVPILAQEGVLEDLYGRGVHAYFERRYEEAHSLLTKAITSGLKDPRAYYFRGLTYIRLGRPQEALAEFNTGAEMELLVPEPIDIGRALERVQGAERLKIEAARRAARLTHRNRVEAAARARYEQRLEDERRVLIDPNRRPTTPAPVPEKPDVTDPFSDAGQPPAPLPAVRPGEARPAPVPPASEPAPAAPKPAEPKPAADDPFANPKPTTPKPGEPANPAEPKAEGANPAAAAEPPRGSVFGSLFRAVSKAVPGEVKNPAPAPVAPKGDPNAVDPFADPAGAKPQPARPAAPSAKPAVEDPFAEPAKPAAAKPAVDDPFAEKK
jgi:hypothetical protein